jgi:hypothetical protein
VSTDAKAPAPLTHPRFWGRVRNFLSGELHALSTAVAAAEPVIKEEVVELARAARPAAEAFFVKEEPMISAAAEKSIEAVIDSHVPAAAPVAPVLASEVEQLGEKVVEALIDEAVPK